MSREKEGIGEAEVHPRIHFVFNASSALNFHLYWDFSTHLRVLWVWLTCIGLVLPLFENQPHLLYWSMIRRTDTSSCFIWKEAPA
jgi:hypothetical protein